MKQKVKAFARKIRSRIIDGNTLPYRDKYNISMFHQAWRTLLYKAAGIGIALTKNERNIIKYKYSAKGKRVFIIGNGPSLNKLDLTKLKGEVTIGVNSIFLAEEKMGFVPTHYVVEDNFVAEDRAEQISAYKGSQKWFGNYLRYCLHDDPDVNWMNVRMKYDNYPNFPYFSHNFARQAWTGGSVTYVCMQLAYYLGASEVILIGFDHNYIVPESAEVEGMAITSTEDDPNHFDPSYFGKGYRWHDPVVDRMEEGYKKAARMFKNEGKRMVNATAGGKLECLPRIDFETLF
jgi:hypothetical protein